MLDLNRPEDAKEYIQGWIDRGEIRLGNEALPIKLDNGTDADHLRVAKQLFLYCDPRVPAGAPGEMH